jgi:signal transduction histidine kinase
LTRRPRLTVRARLTLLYSGLFACGGAIIVTVSYVLVARLGVRGQGQQRSAPGSVPVTLEARCRAAKLSAQPDENILAKCNAALQQLGAQRQRNLTLSHLLQYSLITLVVVITLATILGWILSGRALSPVHKITAAARAASEHNLAARVVLTGPRDELRELAGTFNEMLGRLEAAFESQKRFIANASHELRTPLAVMRTTVDVVAGNPDSTSTDLRVMADEIRTAVDHSEQLIGALLILARNERGITVHEQVDLATIAEDVLDSADLQNRMVHLTLLPARISGDPLLAERLIANLVDNAVRYNTAAGDIWISTHTTAGQSRLIVANTGPVVTPADSDRILQPFERLNERAVHDGYGLGLTIVASITAIHGGTVTVQPRNDGGLSVTVSIPSAQTTPSTD